MWSTLTPFFPLSSLLCLLFVVCSLIGRCNRLTNHSKDFGNLPTSRQTIERNFMREFPSSKQ